MTKKYCITGFSVSELAIIEREYNGFSYDYIVNFSKNQEAYNHTKRSIVDVIYVYSQQLSDKSEYGGIFSTNIFATWDGIYGIDSQGNITRFKDNSSLFFMRTGNISKSFQAFLTLYAQKYFWITIIFPVHIENIWLLSSKCHNIFFSGKDSCLRTIVPFIIRGDIVYLEKFIVKYYSMSEKIIIKKWWTSSGEGIQISDIGENLIHELDHFLSEHLTQDYVISPLLEVTDLEYRVYWKKDWEWKVHVLQVHGKRRKKGMLLHNIAQGNTLEKIDMNSLPSELYASINFFCSQLIESYGWLDVLETRDWKYVCTENNIMTGYLCEDEEIYFAKEWLDAVASTYPSY
jgi:hypothetical protein